MTRPGWGTPENPGNPFPGILWGPRSNKRTECWCAAWWDTVAWRDRSSWSGSAGSMALCGCSPTSTRRRPSGFRLRRATVERGAARVGATTNHSPRRIGYCVGVASFDKTAKRGGWDLPKRTYRTRVSPTLGCWPLVLPWLMADPLLTGQQAMQRLKQEHPGLYLGSLRTLQRRMGEWRITHTEQVVGQQMGAIRDQENSQLHSKKPMPAGCQLDG